MGKWVDRSKTPASTRRPAVVSIGGMTNLATPFSLATAETMIAEMVEPAGSETITRTTTKILMREAHVRGVQAGALAALPAGFVRAPLEPSEDQLIAGFECEAATVVFTDPESVQTCKDARDVVLKIYRAMIAETSDVTFASAAARDVLAERRRQVEVEEWTTEADDRWQNGELAGAAACYAMHGLKIPNTDLASMVCRLVRDLWPWASSWWKPKGRRADLVRAGALIIAEIERIDRAAAKAGGAISDD